MELRSRRPESGRCLTLSAGMASGPLRHAGHVVSAAGGAGRGWGGVPLLGALEAHVAPCEVVRVALQNPTPAVETAQPGREIVTMGLAAYVRADPVALLGLLPLAALVLAEADGRRCLAAVRLRQVELTLEQIREHRAIQFGPQRQRTNLSSAECRGGCV